jgi:large conductance mechanosensitive channel
MGLISEFKEFVMKGNVLDMAVGIIIGSAFAAIVDSMVGDVLMPLIGIIIGGFDFSTASLTVGDAKLLYGKAIQATINFLIIAFILFLILKAANKGRVSSGKPA